MVYAAAARWRDQALYADGSLFSPERQIWVPPNLTAIEPRLAIAPAQGSDYRSALATQLSGAPQEQVQLYAEALFFYFLPTVQTSGKTKRDLLEFVRAFAVGTPGVPADLDPVLDHGIYDPGMHYNMSRADMLRYLLATALKVKALPAAERDDLRTDPWKWRAFLYAAPIKHVHQMRDGLLHLLFPDTFERIVAGEHKQRIVTTFPDLIKTQQANVDQQILEIRQGLEEELGAGFDFYEPHVLSRWYPSGEGGPGPSPNPARQRKDSPGATTVAEEDGPPRTYARLAAALQWRGQVILYGPPGTGKTWTSLRFAVWWLATQLGLKDADEVWRHPAGDARLRLDRELAPVERRTWLVVANPKIWRWERFNQQKTVDFDFGRVQRNFALVRPNDLVIGYQSTPDKRVLALGRVIEGLHRTPSKQEGVITIGDGKIVQNGPSYEELRLEPRLSSSEPLRLRMQGTLFSLTEEESSVLLSLVAERDPAAEEVTFGSISAGPLTRVTFHPSYSYEDFVEGFRPIEAGSGQLALRMTDGVFKRVCREALANPSTPYLVLIDEVNRGNLPRIFGELITLLEKDKRGLTVALPQSHELFSVPPNVYLLGTMNTADRSIRLLDAAIRRRFAFEELMPEPELLKGESVGDLDLELFLRGLNSRIAIRVGREKQIGHSFLLDIGEGDRAVEFARRFTQEILPLLQEYAYEDYETLGALIGDELVDRHGKTIRREILDDPMQLIDALYRSFQGPSVIAPGA